MDRKENKSPFPGSFIYLIIYNVVQIFGWGTTLTEIVRFALQPSKDDLWTLASPSLKFFQTLAVLEVAHTAFRLVKSSSLFTAFQVASRLFVLWLILDYSPEARASIGFPLLLVCWTLAEVIRYSFYLVNLLKMEFYPLLWLRYSMFIILYPLGVTGELLCMFAALHKIKSEEPLGILPVAGGLNWAYFGTIAMMLLYIPVFPKLYFHMLSQRKKALPKEQTRKKSKKT